MKKHEINGGGNFMFKAQINLQDAFLNRIRKENVLVTIFLLNGFQIKGWIKGFDNFTVLVDSENKQQMIYKHAISTIMPLQNVNISFS